MVNQKVINFTEKELKEMDELISELWYISSCIERSMKIDNTIDFEYTNEFLDRTITKDLILEETEDHLIIKDGGNVLDRILWDTTCFYVRETGNKRYIYIVDNNGVYKSIKYKRPIKETMEMLRDDFEKISWDYQIFNVIQINEANINNTKVKLLRLELDSPIDGDLIIFVDAEGKLQNDNEFCPVFNFEDIKYAYVQGNKVVINTTYGVTIIEGTEEKISDKWWKENEIK